MLSNVSKSKEIRQRIKLNLFNSNVKSVLLCGSETWWAMKTSTHKLQTFIVKCLLKVLVIIWTYKVAKYELWNGSGQQPVGEDLVKRKWGWIGHTLRKPHSSSSRHALKWKAQEEGPEDGCRTCWMFLGTNREDSSGHRAERSLVTIVPEGTEGFERMNGKNIMQNR